MRSTYGHPDDRQATNLRRWWGCKNGYTRHTRVVWSMYGYTQTIGKQETCVAGGVKTGIPDTHTNSVVNVWTHTDEG